MSSIRQLIAAALAILCWAHAANAVIYGNDDRTDIYEMPQLKTIARAVAVAVPNLFLQKAKDGTYEVTDTESLRESGGSYVCTGERFENQPSMGVCSGFLIGDRYLITAGHCVLPNGVVDNQFHPFCEDFSWYFDYNMKGPNDFPTKNIPADRIYGCKNVIRAENINSLKLEDAGNDFALIELDRPVAKDITPLPLQSKPVAAGDEVYTIGHPTGLPAKYSGTAPVLTLPRPNYFTVNLDTEGGNSGGVVLNTRGEVTGILVSGFPDDYYDGGPNGCQRVNHCDENGRNCVVNSQEQYSNFVQKIENVIPYLPPNLGTGAGT